jgi:hypothetical protein
MAAAVSLSDLQLRSFVFYSTCARSDFSTQLSLIGCCHLDELLSREGTYFQLMQFIAVSSNGLFVFFKSYMPLLEIVVC